MAVAPSMHTAPQMDQFRFPDMLSFSGLNRELLGNNSAHNTSLALALQVAGLGIIDLWYPGNQVHPTRQLSCSSFFSPLKKKKLIVFSTADNDFLAHQCSLLNAKKAEGH